MVPAIDPVLPIGSGPMVPTEVGSTSTTGGTERMAPRSDTTALSARSSSPVVEPPHHGPPHTLDLSLDPQNARHLPSDVYVRYYVNRGIGNYVVQVIDRRTGEVIREIPPGQAADFLREIGML